MELERGLGLTLDNLSESSYRPAGGETICARPLRPLPGQRRPVGSPSSMGFPISVL